MARGIKKVGVIGAGVSGVAAAAHLHASGLEVTVFERSAKAGGVWVYDERTAFEPAYPSLLPSVGDCPDGVVGDESDEARQQHNMRVRHAPPGPCYIGLKNNVSTREMKLQVNSWKEGMEDFVSHSVLEEYVQDTAVRTGVEPRIQYNTRVREVQKISDGWKVSTSELVSKELGVELVESDWEFDALVVASGHYHAPRIPDLPGLRDWKQRWPDRIHHSKSYRRPEAYQGENVLLIGAGVSSMDIARELGSFAQRLYQSSRGGKYDLPASMLPENGVRIGEIAAFEDTVEGNLEADSTLPGKVRLKSGQELCNIHRIIICTGYHISYPFLRSFHADNVAPEAADKTVLVTDGTQTHNLHKDIFYIADPTLAFVGVPYHIATFSFFEFQAITVAAVFSGQAKLPPKAEMRQEYVERLARKGAGREFHSMKERGAEIAYVQDLVTWINSARTDGKLARGHSEQWHEAYRERLQRLSKLGRDIGTSTPGSEEVFLLQKLVLCS